MATLCTQSGGDWAVLLTRSLGGDVRGRHLRARSREERGRARLDGRERDVGRWQIWQALAVAEAEMMMADEQLQVDPQVQKLRCPPSFP